MMQFDKNTGFTLVEVLVAMLVLAVGLLGLAGLQARSIKNNQSAYYRSQATQLAYDMADRIRANTAQGQLFSASIYDSTVKSPSTAVNNPACLTTTGCTPAQMAEHDLYEWNQELTRLLPLGQGSIQGNTGSSTFTITINWDDNGDGNVDSSDPNFSVSFQL